MRKGRDRHRYHEILESVEPFYSIGATEIIGYPHLWSGDKVIIYGYLISWSR